VKVIAQHSTLPLVVLDDGTVIDTEDLEVVGRGTVEGPDWDTNPDTPTDPRWEEIARADAANLGVTERKVAGGSRTFRAPSHVRDHLAQSGVDTPLVEGKGLTFDELAALSEHEGVTGPAEEWMFAVLNKHEDNPNADAEAELFSLAEPELDYDEIDAAIDGDAARDADPSDYNDDDAIIAAAGANALQVGDTVRLNVPGDQLGGARPETPVECSGTVTDIEPDQVTVRVTDAADGPLEEPVTVAVEPANVIVAAVEPPPGDFAKVVYLAIIEEDDTKSVQDLVALVSTKSGAADAFVYGVKGWAEDKAVLAKLQSTAPPPIQQLEDWQTESIVGQMKSTSEMSKEATSQPWEDDSAAAPAEGDAVQASAFDVPRANVLWGPNGTDVLTIVAASHAAGHWTGNAQRLRDYWQTGEGGAKIRWNTPGDWKRCHRHLSRYLGTRSAGYCSLMHHRMTGTWPGSRFNIGGNGR
jgi:hypothetical protein